jgi:hypothetical protein
MFSSYVALMSSIIDSEPSNIEEVAKKQEWKNAMMEKYHSIMKNDVWEVVPRPKGKSVVTSKLIYKIKHATDKSAKRDLWLEDSPSKREKTMTKLLLL